MHGWRLVTALLGTSLLVGCAEPTAPVDAPRREGGRVVEFSYVALDGARVDSRTLRGRATVILLFTSYDVVSQMAARVASDVLHEHRPRINVLGVALEAPKYDVLIRAFGDSLGLGYPLAMADRGSLAGGGPFGPIVGIPTWVVLDPAGREVWRHVGPLRRAELRSALDLALKGRPKAGE
jgi:hypothetical protein